jgi:serine protease Do
MSRFKREPRSTSWIAVVLALLGLGLSGGIGHAQRVASSAEAAGSEQGKALPDMARIAAQFSPSVVNISIRGTHKVSTVPGAAGVPPGSASDPEDPDSMAEFLRRFQQRFGGLPAELRLPVQGEGSGFIVREDGVVLTNAHVVKDADEVTVRLTDRREFSAKVLGTDVLTDIAVLKIEAHGLPAAALSPPHAIRAGDWVMAIGSPFGFESTVTAGVVSAPRRALPDDSAVPFIQTDAAINPGNSGGPLINMAGEVIGINSQIYSRTGGYQGLSFAIPIDLAQRIAQQILATGQVRHARLGVHVQEVDQALAEAFRMPRPTGALIDDVQQGSSADRAGLRSGDVLMAIGGQTIEYAGDMAAFIGVALPDESVSIDVWRRGAKVTVRVRMDGPEPPAPPPAAKSSDAETRLGLALRPPRQDEVGDTGSGFGLVVEAVSGAAERAGVMPGDLLLAIDGEPVGSVAEAKGAANWSGRSVALLVQRAGRKLFLPVRLTSQ